MTDKEIMYLIAGIGIFLLVYIIIIVNNHKKSSEIDKKIIRKMNNDRAIQQELIKKATNPIKIEPRYQLKPSVTSLTENFLNEVLTKYCKNNNLILSHKARLADFLNPIITYNVNFDKAVKQAKSVYVDFLISANANGNFEPIAAVILDDQWIGDTSVDEILEETDLEVFCFDELDEDRIIRELNDRLKTKIQYFKYLP